uniref:RNase H type-1 domain-containing protein n=1 Tax=Panagrolaimus davidi TaxID=227884 RepID=A0A914P2A5_9BILA
MNSFIKIFKGFSSQRFSFKRLSHNRKANENARFEKIQSPFKLLQKLKNVSVSDVNLEAFATDSDTYDPASNEKTIFVHSAYIEKPTTVDEQPFKIAAYGVRFKGNGSLDIKDRMGGFISHLRAQMYGILKALEVAKMDGLKNVQIVYDSSFFIQYYKKGWKKNDGGKVANYPLYIEILKLADEVNASFRYLPRESDNPDFQAAALLAEDGLGMPVTDVKGSQAGKQSGDKKDKTGVFKKNAQLCNSNSFFSCTVTVFFYKGFSSLRFSFKRLSHTRKANENVCVHL